MSFLGLPVFAVFHGLDWIATVPPTVRLTTQTLGSTDGPIAFGWIVAAHQVGAEAGALLVLRIGRGAPRASMAAEST